VSVEFLLDTSAWARSDHQSLPASRANGIAEDWEMGRLAVCLPFFLEAGYSARSGREHAEITEELLALPFLRIDETVEARAMDVQSQLARVGHHRLPFPDLLIAALAERHGVGVLHYDGDYDVLVERTDLGFYGEWLMPRGSLN
jgi:predicted nucleic acid-binding protein